MILYISLRNQINTSIIVIYGRMNGEYRERLFSINVFSDIRGKG